MENSEDFPNSGNQMNSQFSQNSAPSNSPQVRRTTQINQASQFQNAEPSNNSRKQDAQGWTDEQDIALISAWYFYSENAITGRNKNEDHFWKCVSEMYEQARVENPHKMGEQRSKEFFRSRYRRLNKNATKWMGAFKKANDRATSGTSDMDILSNAHKLYGGKGRFPDIDVYIKVMRHVPKWKVKFHDRTRPCSDDNDFEEGHDSSKKSRTDEGGNPMEVPQASDASTINRPMGREKAKSLRKGKDVERAFGVLQARFSFIRRPCLLWDRDMMGKIMTACLIMHNMIVEDERHTYANYMDPTEFMHDQPPCRNNQNESQEGGADTTYVYSTERIGSLASYMCNMDQLTNREEHNSLKNDLIEHIWQIFGDGN